MVVVVLLVTAYVTRRRGLPHDGLFFDDAVTAVGTRAPLSKLLTVGYGSPTFTALLAGWSRLVPGSSQLAYPALAAGTIGPAVLYLALRRFGYARSIAVLLAAALVASHTHILFASRVKTYTIDPLVVLGLTAVLPRLVRARWRVSTGVAWLVVAFAVASFSAFTMVAVAGAGVVLLVHRNDDLRVRGAAIATQLACSAALLAATQRTFDSSALESQWKRVWDAFVGFDPSPIRFVAHVVRHLRRIAEVFPAGIGWWAWVWITAALVGLAVTALARDRSPTTLRARYLGLVLVIAVGASVLGRFPLGPARRIPLSPGGRVTLWLMPIVAIGLAAVLQWLRRELGRRRRLGMGFDPVAYALTAVVLIVALGRGTVAYPFPGSRTSTRYVIDHLGADDAVLITTTSIYPFALESGLPVDIEDRPDGTIGYVAKARDRRMHIIEPSTTADRLRPVLARAARVFVHVAEPGAGPPKPVLTMVLALRSAGFAHTRTIRFGKAVVSMWTR